MAETTWALLRGLLADRYGDFKARLARRIGSEELAGESLHETWLRLHRPGDVGPVQSPAAYLLRVAFNIAQDRLRAESRRARRSVIQGALEIADPAPDPMRRAEARAELKALECAISGLPERSRTILIASRLEGLTHQAIADRLGISRRTVLYELRRTIDHLEMRLEDIGPNGCAHDAPKSSLEDDGPRDD
jgi:RNA polymerase sigma factor (sigma-70 family)